VLREVLPEAEGMGLTTARGVGVKHNLGLALTHPRRLEEGLAVEEEAAAAFAAQGDQPSWRPAARKYLAMNHLAAGRVEDATRGPNAALRIVLPDTPGHATRWRLKARAHVAAGRPRRRWGRRARRSPSSRSSADGRGRGMVRLAHAEALKATGADADARSAIVSMRAWLEERVARIRDPARARSFLEEVPENARALALARAWE
jgi:hypothetical protein